MFTGFLYELRKRGVPVGAQEALSLADALQKNLHETSLTGYYHVARSLLIHSENHLDAFDEAFLTHYRAAELASLKIHQDLLDWLKEAQQRRDLSPEELAMLERFDPDELRRMFEERLRQQKERHDGGNRWIGTGGSSPFGHSGAAREGIRIGGPGGNRSAIGVADARNYKGYRSDHIVDVRQFSVALRKLRSFAREGGELELDLDGTVDATAKNAGELEVVVRPPRRPNTRVILMMDVGGSMDPYIREVEQLFTAASKATHFKDFRSYFFHNCVYQTVWATEEFTKPLPVVELLRTCGRHYKLVVIGDAAMAPYELVSPRGHSFFGPPGKSGLEVLQDLQGHFERAVWLNPEPRRYWQGAGSTRHAIGQLFPMFPLTLEGLGEAISHLNAGKFRTH